jgi:hypothetical protein
MWKITNRGFTLQEVLIMAAMNVAPALIETDKVRDQACIDITPRKEGRV